MILRPQLDIFTAVNHLQATDGCHGLPAEIYRHMANQSMTDVSFGCKWVSARLSCVQICKLEGRPALQQDVNGYVLHLCLHRPPSILPEVPCIGVRSSVGY